MAKGNGNHVIESGETVELTAFVRNNGVGPALGVNLVGSDMTTGVTWLSGHDTALIGTIAPGETAKAKLAFSVPPNFDAKNIAAILRVADVRPIETAEYKFAQGYSKKSPDVQYGYQIYSKGVKVDKISNGGEYDVELTVSNKGQMAAKNVVATISPAQGVRVSRTRMDIGDVKDKSSAPVQRFTLSVPRTYSAPNIPISVEMNQAYFAAVNSNIQIPVAVKIPNLSYTAKPVSKNKGNTLEQREQATLEVIVTNSGGLTAEGVKIALLSSNEDLQVQGQKEMLVGTIPANSSADPVKFQITAKPRLKPGEASLDVRITQDEFPLVSKQYALNILEEGATVIDVAGEGSRPKATTVALNQAGPKINLKGAAVLPQEPVEDDTYRLAFDVSDIKNLSKVSVLVNGRAIAALDEAIMQQIRAVKNKSKIPILLEVPLEEGVNTVRIIAENTAYEKSAPKEFKISRSTEKDVEMPPKTGRDNKNAVAIVIGISKQEDSGIGSALYAKQDAKTIYEYLYNELGYRKANIIFVTDEEARTPTLRIIFQTKLQQKIVEAHAKEVFVYYSGHGLPIGDDRYLLTYDANESNYQTTAYPVKELYEEIAKLNIKSTIVLDACYTGNTGNGEKIIQSTSAAIKRTKNPADRIKAGIIFAAAANDQFANWYHDKKHGLFTYYFLQGIAGGADKNSDGKITVGELKGYVGDKVLAQSLKKGETYRQTPEVEVKGGNEDDIIVEAYQ